MKTLIVAFRIHLFTHPFFAYVNLYLRFIDTICLHKH